MPERYVAHVDIIAVISRAKRCLPYDCMPEHGGTTWRVIGPDLDGRQLAVGVETYVDEKKKAVVLITVFDTRSVREKR